MLKYQRSTVYSSSFRLENSTISNSCFLLKARSGQKVVSYTSRKTLLNSYYFRYWLTNLQSISTINVYNICFYINAMILIIFWTKWFLFYKMSFIFLHDIKNMSFDTVCYLAYLFSKIIIKTKDFPVNVLNQNWLDTLNMHFSDYSCIHIVKTLCWPTFLKT